MPMIDVKKYEEDKDEYEKRLKEFKRFLEEQNEQ